jgi:hypothetical protein
MQSGEMKIMMALDNKEMGFEHTPAPSETSFFTLPAIKCHNIYTFSKRDVRLGKPRVAKT